MARVVLVAALVLPLAIAGCDSSTDNSSSTPQTPYAGGSTQPAAPARTPLTQADIDKWMKITLDSAKTKPRSPADMKALLERNNSTETEWGNLFVRVQEANTALIGFEKRNTPIPPDLVADVELVKANRTKIELARAGKSE